jgi:hypothetical protein
MTMRETMSYSAWKCAASYLFFNPFNFILILVCEALGFLQVLFNTVSQSLLGVCERCRD